MAIDRLHALGSASIVNDVNPIASTENPPQSPFDKGRLPHALPAFSAPPLWRVAQAARTQSLQEAMAKRTPYIDMHLWGVSEGELRRLRDRSISSPLHRLFSKLDQGASDPQLSPAEQQYAVGCYWRDIAYAIVTEVPEGQYFSIAYVQAALTLSIAAKQRAVAELAESDMTTRNRYLRGTYSDALLLDDKQRLADQVATMLGADRNVLVQEIAGFLATKQRAPEFATVATALANRFSQILEQLYERSTSAQDFLTAFAFTEHTHPERSTLLTFLRPVIRKDMLPALLRHYQEALRIQVSDFLSTALEFKKVPERDARRNPLPPIQDILTRIESLSPFEGQLPLRIVLLMLAELPLSPEQRETATRVLLFNSINGSEASAAFTGEADTLAAARALLPSQFASDHHPQLQQAYWSTRMIDARRAVTALVGNEIPLPTPPSSQNLTHLDFLNYYRTLLAKTGYPSSAVIIGGVRSSDEELRECAAMGRDFHNIVAIMAQYEREIRSSSAFADINGTDLVRRLFQTLLEQRRQDPAHWMAGFDIDAIHTASISQKQLEDSQKAALHAALSRAYHMEYARRSEEEQRREEARQHRWRK